MHADERNQSVLKDVQAESDYRGIEIDQAGIEGLRLPVLVEDVDSVQCATVMNIRAAVGVRKSQRGAHLSRLVEEFENLDGRLSIQGLNGLYERLCDRCDAKQGYIDLSFPWFIEKSSPVSGSRSNTGVDAGYVVRGVAYAGIAVTQRVSVPVTTLCPCSKAISRYGAHNQRSMVTVACEMDEQMAIGELVTLIEACSSCEIYGVLKRADEKYVTEKAYEHPRFVEDVARDVYAALNARRKACRMRVEVTSQESIHNHQAYAVVDDWRR